MVCPLLLFSFGLMIGRTTIKSGNPVLFKTGVRSGRNYYTYCLQARAQVSRFQSTHLKEISWVSVDPQAQTLASLFRRTTYRERCLAISFHTRGSIVSVDKMFHCRGKEFQTHDILEHALWAYLWWQETFPFPNNNSFQRSSTINQFAFLARQV